jgi:hypothetical protein
MVEKTPGTVPFSDCDERWFLLTADVHDVLAAWGELAADGRGQQVRGTPFDRNQAFPVLRV